MWNKAVKLWRFGTSSRKADMSSMASGLGARLAKYPCFDFELYIDPSDAILGPIVQHGIYEHHILPIYLDTIQRGSRVLDIGANVGVYSIAAARKGAEVLAIEASTENSKLIDLNARHNGVDVKVVPVAVSDTFGMAFLERTQQSNKTVRPLSLTLETFDQIDAVPAVPLNSIIGNERFDVVKIDIEGREYAALKPAEMLFAHRPVFFVEYSAAFVKYSCGVEGTDLIRLFTDRNYVATHLNLRGPNVELGADPIQIDQVWQRENAEGMTIIDLMFRPR
jgi:FkbM family methyltransferase